MNENARKWIEALRSGEFKQAQERLRTHKRFCCLGVACELYVREGGAHGAWEGWTWVGDDEKQGQVLPVDVMEWLGLRTAAGYFERHGALETSLAAKNDRGASFEEIADVIESEPEGLFR